MCRKYPDGRCEQGWSSLLLLWNVGSGCKSIKSCQRMLCCNPSYWTIGHLYWCSRFSMLWSHYHKSRHPLKRKAQDYWRNRCLVRCTVQLISSGQRFYTATLHQWHLSYHRWLQRQKEHPWASFSIPNLWSVFSHLARVRSTVHLARWHYWLGSCDSFWACLVWSSLLHQRSIAYQPSQGKESRKCGSWMS